MTPYNLRATRVPIEVEIELYRDGCETLMLRTENLSDSGVLILMDEEDRPDIGMNVKLRVVGPLGGGEEPPLVEAVVVRHCEEGIGLAFK